MVGSDAFDARLQDRIGAAQQQCSGRTCHGRQVAGHSQQRNLEPERGALAGRGLHADAALHQVDDALADGQAQAGTPVDAGGGGVGLAEGLEQPRLQHLVDADAGVDDLEAQLVLRCAFAQPLYPQQHLAACRELDRVGQQVAQHLAQAYRVAAYRQAHRWVQLQRQRQALGVGGALHQLHHAIEQVTQVEAVEDVVDDAQQLLRTGRGGGQHLSLVLAQGAARDQLQHRQDAVERGADLMAHRGQELALGQHRGLGGLLGLQQLLLQLALAFGGTAQLVAFGGQYAAFALQLGQRKVARAQPQAKQQQRDGGHGEGNQQHAPQRHVRAPRCGSRSSGRCRPTAPCCPGCSRRRPPTSRPPPADLRSAGR
ncbi:hypothetical protein G6F65_014979 [Rhizopus arrhizus]|nr:hypothetical protein G6F65_014979 [Rhizopus arrhizus]